MARKFFPKALSVGLSLALCASLAAPAFAASFTELQGAINTGSSVYQEDGKTYKIEASKDETGAVNVKLHEDVEREKGEGSITIKKGDVTIDMNGYTLDGKGEDGSVIKVGGGLQASDLAEDGSVPESNLTINAGERTDESGNMQVGTITGGNSKSDGTQQGLGGGIYVSNGATFEMNGGIVSNNHAETLGGGIASAGGSVTLNGVTVEGNTADQGGGIYVGDVHETGKVYDGELHVNDGVIKDNHATNCGGGVSMTQAKDVTINGTEISENGASKVGGGIYASETSVKLDGVSVTENDAVYGGGLYSLASNVEFGKDVSSITENDALCGGGLYCYGSTITAENGSVIANNDATYGADDIYIRDTTISLPNAGAMNEKLSDGKNITGWYFDVGERWSHGQFGYYKYDSGTFYFTEGYLKAAHDPYFNVIFMDGVGENNGTALKTAEVENGSAIPGYGAQNPSREGYDFIGWRLADDSEVDFENGVVDGELILVAQWELAEEDPGIEIPDPDVPLGPGPDDIEIDDAEIPLAGLFTRGDAIGYLWEKSGSPEWELSDFEDVPEDHQWAVAIGWAQDMGIAVADLEGNFRPDDLVLHSVEDIELSPEGELQEFLNRYAVYAGIVLEPGELFIELDGAWDDIVMGEDAQVIFDDFFAKLEVALAQAKAA